MSAFDLACGFVLDIEGGAVRDSGGLTRFGIAQHAYPRLDIAALTQDQARAIYLTDYWRRCRCDALPAVLAIALFDGAVNQGPETAVRLLQEALRVRVDGRIGRVTVAAAQAVIQTGTQAGEQEERLARFLALRAVRYADTDGASRYLEGWMYRLLRLGLWLGGMGGS